MKPGALFQLCEKPRIKAAMQKEQITQAMLANVNVDLHYLNAFEKNEKLYKVYQNGHLSFSDYALAPERKQNHIIWFLEHFKNIDEALTKKHINLSQHVCSFPSAPNAFTLLNSKFVQHLLDTNKISIEKYLTNDKVDELYALSALFLIDDVESFIDDGFLSIDQILTLKAQDLIDLAKLLSNRDWDAREWFNADYLTITQFLQCEPNDRETYQCFMYRNNPKNDFTLSYFLSLRPSTREYIRFNQDYITPKKFDQLATETQKILSEILFSNMGLYALQQHYITIEQFCDLSTPAQEAMSFIFYAAHEEYRGVRSGKEVIDEVFSNGLDFEHLNTIAEQSKDAAWNYLHELAYPSRPMPSIR